MSGYDFYIFVEAFLTILGAALTALMLPDGETTAEKITAYMGLFFMSCIAGLISVVTVPHTVIGHLALRWINFIFTPFVAGLLCIPIAKNGNSDAQAAKFWQGFVMASDSCWCGRLWRCDSGVAQGIEVTQ